MISLVRGAAVFVVGCAMAIPAMAQTASARDMLIQAAFATHDKDAALALINQAIAETSIALARNPADRDAKLQQTLAIGYRGQLKRSIGDAKAAYTALTRLGAAYPADPEVQVAIGGWHLTAISDIGSFLAGTLLGANKRQGLAAVDRAIALGGDRACFTGYAALIRIRLDSDDTATALALARRADGADTPTSIDRIMQHAAQRITPLLQAGNGEAAARLARQLLPFGSLS